MNLLYKGLGTMKISRDSGSISNANKIIHSNALESVFPSATHDTLDFYYENRAYHSLAYIQEWIDAVRATGKNVWFRGVPNWTGLTAAQSITNISDLIGDNPTWFEDGDIFEFAPESHPYMFSDPPDNWNNSTQLWSQWIADMIASCDVAFANIGKPNVITTIQSVTSSYATQGDLKAVAITAMNNQISIDYYPLDHSSLDPEVGVTNLMNKLNVLHTNYPNVKIIISEIGATNAVSSTDEQQTILLDAAFEKIKTLDYVIGLNYWVIYNHSGGGGHTNLFETGSLDTPRPAAASLELFYNIDMATSWFIAPYESDIAAKPLPRRWCAMDKYTKLINDDGGTWEEIEVGANHAIVKVKATNQTIYIIDKEFTKIPVNSLNANLASLTAAKKTKINDLMTEMGYTPTEIENALTSDIGAKKLKDLFEFISSRRIPPRFDPELNEIVFDSPAKECTKTVDEVDGRIQ